jgi:CheY-like chemotaxis protein
VREPLELLRRVVIDSAASVRRIQSVARAQKSGPAAVFDLAIAARESLEVTRPRWRDEAQARGIDYRIEEAAPEGLWIAGQASEMREALMNLVLNAIDAMPGGGPLRIEGEAVEGRVWLRVRDDGIGMTPEVARRAFDPFFTTKGELGTGLGLAIVYGVVQRHGGGISVETHPGRGTCFVLNFPLAAAPDAASGIPAPPAARSLRVLVVDDERPVGRLCATLLETGGHTVLVAEDGPSALALARAHSPDVVMTDLGMPGMNGWALSAALREEFPQLPIILVTGWGDMLDPQQIAAHGIVRILTKPYSLADLLESVAAIPARLATPPPS